MSSLPVIQEIEQSYMKEEALPDVRVGDTVAVSTYIVEGKKRRLQKYEGIVIKIQGALSRRSLTVRKIIDNVGVEKSFLFHSPILSEIKILKQGKVRRARLHYLRQRVGAKATRVKTKDPVVGNA
jgi:large subunit ribosomal protein L19